jgi:hypothetical protein
MVFALAFAFALSACGNPGTPNATSSTPPGGTSSPTASPTAGDGSSSGTTGSPKPPKPNSTPRITGKPTPVATASGGSYARLDRTCARRGVDTQGLTLHTDPKGPASYNTQYSDGSYNGDGSSHYSSGYGYGPFADDQGNWYSTWVPPADAPLGLAIVHVPTVDGLIELSFTIVSQIGHCA